MGLVGLGFCVALGGCERGFRAFWVGGWSVGVGWAWAVVGVRRVRVRIGMARSFRMVVLSVGG